MPPRKICSRMQYVRSFRSHEPQIDHTNQTQFDPIRFTFSIIVNGCSFTEGESMFLWNNLLPPSQSAFYRAQKIISAEIFQMAKSSCDFWKGKMTPDSCIAFDGSWSHRRNAMHCLVDFIDTKSKKVVDFEVISKLDPDFNGSSNSMECFGLKKMIPRWINNKKVTHYVHDNDAKSRKLIHELGWNIEEYIDLNHYMKSFRRKFEKYKNLSPTKFRGIKIKLERFFQSLMHLNSTEEYKIFLWRNVVNHFAGNHSDCLKHKPTRIWNGIIIEGNKEALTTFIDKTCKLLTKCSAAHSTQMCESLHAVKAHFANKMICWKSSWTARICAAILDFNGPGWEFQLYDRLKLPPLSPIIYKKLQIISKQKWEERVKRATNEYKLASRNKKKEKRIRNKIDEKDLTYRGNKKVRSSSQMKTAKVENNITKMPEKFESFNKWFEQFGFDGSRKDDLYDREWKLKSANLNDDECYIENYKSFLINDGYQENDIHKDYELMISENHDFEFKEDQFSENQESSSSEEETLEEEDVKVFDCTNIFEINGENED